MQAASSEIDIETKVHISSHYLTRKVASLVNKHLQEMEDIESNFTIEFEKTKVRQKAEFHDFVMKFYTIEVNRVKEAKNSSTSDVNLFMDDFVNIGG